MVSRHKTKGDKAERDAVVALVALAPDLVCEQPMRMLGAGRSDDVGDLRVFDDVAVQVRAYQLKDITQGLRSAAVDAVQQAGHGRVPFSMGLVPFPNARPPRVRWIATACVWPDPAVVVRPFGMSVSKALSWVREDTGLPRELRVALISGRGAPDYCMAPLEGWLAAYRTARSFPTLAAA